MRIERVTISGIRRHKTYVLARKASGWTKLKDEVWIQGDNHSIESGPLPESSEKQYSKNNNENWQIIKMDY